MTTLQIIGEVLSACAGALLVISFFFNTKIMMCLFSAIANGLWVVGLGLINGWSGMIFSAILFILGLTNFFFFGRKNKPVAWWFWVPFAVISVATFIVFYLLFNGVWTDLFPFVATFLTVAVYPVPPKHTWLVRVFFLLGSTSWLTWGIMISLIGNIIANSLVLISNICFFIYYEFYLPKKKQKTERFSQN